MFAHVFEHVHAPTHKIQTRGGKNFFGRNNKHLFLFHLGARRSVLNATFGGGVHDNGGNLNLASRRRIKVKILALPPKSPRKKQTKTENPDSETNRARFIRSATDLTRTVLEQMYTKMHKHVHADNGKRTNKRTTDPFIYYNSHSHA